MNERSLRISDDLSLPLEAVTETFAIFGKRGKGKTNAAVVLVEELFRAGLPVVVLDPIGVWYGLKASADGSGLVWTNRSPPADGSRLCCVWIQRRHARTGESHREALRPRRVHAGMDSKVLHACGRQRASIEMVAEGF